MTGYEFAKKELISELETIMRITIDENRTVYETVLLERCELDEAVQNLVPNNEQYVSVTSFAVKDVTGFIIANNQNKDVWGIGFIGSDGTIKEWRV
ncbi:hypothetical protein FC48_GL001705 [Ligilactobacillus murinus DSM 20452 = NBRC 14221]|uniref:Uncharacterized protein n=1 Tax=Ligilactobacillus murinus DSM 20452 = NBRC 14221 TaxID=1423772 RepID=A0A0R2B3R3_9LACO|nr:hypothetical protein [Ligilactobacillus murinus]KRM70534.1 hypothetical protein FC48_GL001705 [Ligilactobacillus murinus DSM 20452 = NBRC 14221]